MVGRLVVFCFSGKRKSGKDYICSRLQNQLESRGFRTVIRGISYPLKEEYAQLYKLDAEKLKFDYEYKELVRKSMVEFGEQVRAKDSSYFCRFAIFNSSKISTFYSEKLWRALINWSHTNLY
jgi:phosphomevalonate kinase